MSSVQDQAIEGAWERARAAGDGARGAAMLDSRPSVIRLGVVVSGSPGVYTVGVVGATGSVVDTVPGVHAWGDVVFDSGDRVLLAWIGDRPIPFIVGSGGGDGAGVAVLGVGITNRFFSS